MLYCTTLAQLINPLGAAAQVAPGAGDGEGEAGALDVDEQRSAIGGETGAAEFTFVGVGVHGEGVDAPVRGEAAQVVHRIRVFRVAVFADD